MIKRRIVYFLVFFFVFVEFAQAAFLLDRVVAVVNQEVITWSELYRAMETDATPAVKALPQAERNKIIKENEAMFLENLISFRLQIQEAMNSRARVSEEEVRETIDGIKKKYVMTETQFEESLKAEGYSMEAYKRRLAEQILQSKIVNQQVRSKVIVTDADVEHYMKENKNISDSFEAYHIRQIFFKKPKDEAERGAVEEKAQAVYTKAQQGADFMELARQNSEDVTRETGGDLGFVEKRNLAEDFSSALATMKEGDISKPFWSDRGLHILMLQEIAAPKSSAEIKQAAISALQNKLFTEKYNAWIKSLREKAFIEIRL